MSRLHDAPFARRTGKCARRSFCGAFAPFGDGESVRRAGALGARVARVTGRALAGHLHVGVVVHVADPVVDYGWSQDGKLEEFQRLHCGSHLVGLAEVAEDGQISVRIRLLLDSLRLAGIRT